MILIITCIASLISTKRNKDLFITNVSNKKGTKRTVIEIDMPDQEQNQGQRESSRARRSGTTSNELFGTPTSGNEE